MQEKKEELTEKLDLAANTLVVLTTGKKEEAQKAAAGLLEKSISRLWAESFL